MRRRAGVLVAWAVAALVAVAVPATAAAGDVYAALGDSFASGVGTGSYSLSTSCKQSVYAYPYLVAQKRGAALTFLACSGATTVNVMASQVPAIPAGTTIVTVTVGGNDIHFADLIYQCTLTDCSATLDSTAATLESTVGKRLDDLYDAIKAKAPGAKIVVAGYPHVFNGSSCLGNLGISAAERTKANALADALDTTISTHAHAKGLVYERVIDAFASHAVCSSGPWLNGLNLLSTSESYHPNKNGQSLGYAPLVLAGLTG